MIYIVDQRWPILLFQVDSVDNWQRYSIEGYGFIEIPKDPGFHEILIPTWKPHHSISEKIHSFYLGICDN